MTVDALGDRMKSYEGREDRRFLPMLPVIARLDGKGFHNFCRTLSRPYDVNLSNLMLFTTHHLVSETGALSGYTQSDEISLLFHSDDPKSQIYFDGRVQKMVSVLAAMATEYFNRRKRDDPRLPSMPALFDCRVWAVPNKVEAANTFLWRELDATKNSISMAAFALFPHHALWGVTSKGKLDMLMDKGVNWNDYPAFFKRGTFVQRRKVVRAFTADEIEDLPAKHEARSNPGLQIERSEVAAIEMPRFSKVTNRVDVLFCGATPTTDATSMDAAAAPDYATAALSAE